MLQELQFLEPIVLLTQRWNGETLPLNWDPWWVLRRARRWDAEGMPCRWWRTCWTASPWSSRTCRTEKWPLSSVHTGAFYTSSFHHLKICLRPWNATTYSVKHASVKVTYRMHPLWATKKKKLFLTFDSQTLFSAIVDITCKSNISEDLKLSRKFIHPV